NSPAAQGIPPRGLCTRGWSARIRLWPILSLYLVVLFRLLRPEAVLELLQARKSLRACCLLALSPIPLQLLPGTLCDRKRNRRSATRTMIRGRGGVGDSS